MIDHQPQYSFCFYRLSSRWAFGPLPIQLYTCAQVKHS